MIMTCPGCRYPCSDHDRQHSCRFCRSWSEDKAEQWDAAFVEYALLGIDDMRPATAWWGACHALLQRHSLPVSPSEADGW